MARAAPIHRAALVTIALALAGSGAFGGVTSAGCSEPYQAEDPVVEASLPDAGIEASAPDAASPDPCDHARGIAPPAVDDAPSTELPAFYLAIRRLELIPVKGAPAVGFDLDGVCTCEPGAGSAFDGGPSCASKEPHCDIARGVDNAASDLAERISPAYPIATAPNGLIASGRRTVLVQVTRYNGKPNDKEVILGLALSDGIRTKGCDGSVQDAETGLWTPVWCGDDPWTFRSDAVIPATKQPLIQTTGWVRDGVLGFQLPTLQIPFAEDATLQMASAVLTGKLVPLGEDLKPRDVTRAPTEREKRLWSLEDGIVGGRVRTTDLLAGLGSLEQPSKGGDAGRAWVCQSVLFDLLRLQVCGSADIARAATFDFTPGAACDAVSTGIGFTAFPVLPGEVRTLAPSVNPCLAGPSGQTPDASTRPYSCD